MTGFACNSFVLLGRKIVIGPFFLRHLEHVTSLSMSKKLEVKTELHSAPFCASGFELVILTFKK